MEIDYSKKVGEIEFVNAYGDLPATFVYELMDSNGLLACCSHEYSQFYKEWKYVPVLKIRNEDHLRNLLGLTKGYPNYMKDHVKRVTLYRHKCKSAFLIGRTFLEAMPDLNVEIVEEL